MTPAFLYTRGECRDPNPECRQDRFPGGDCIANALYKNAFKITRTIHPDQIAHMDPVLRHHLRVGTPKRP